MKKVILLGIAMMLISWQGYAAETEVVETKTVTVKKVEPTKAAPVKTEVVHTEVVKHEEEKSFSQSLQDGWNRLIDVFAPRN